MIDTKLSVLFCWSSVCRTDGSQSEWSSFDSLQLVSSTRCLFVAFGTWRGMSCTKKRTTQTRCWVWYYIHTRVSMERTNWQLLLVARANRTKDQWKGTGHFVSIISVLFSSQIQGYRELSFSSGTHVLFGQKFYIGHPMYYWNFNVLCY